MVILSKKKLLWISCVFKFQKPCIFTMFFSLRYVRSVTFAPGAVYFPLCYFRYVFSLFFSLPVLCTFRSVIFAHGSLYFSLCYFRYVLFALYFPLPALCHFRSVTFAPLRSLPVLVFFALSFSLCFFALYFSLPVLCNFRSVIFAHGPLSMSLCHSRSVTVAP